MNRELLAWLPMQYMLDMVEINPEMAVCREADGMCAVLLGHYLFIGGAYSPEAARFVCENMLTDNITLAYSPTEEWRQGLRDILGEIHSYERRLYVAEPVSGDFSAPCVARVNKNTLSRLDNAEMMIDEVISTATYASMDDFFDRGIGIAVVKDNRVCGFCTSEYPSPGVCAIGIEVAEDMRREGLAKTMTRKFLSEAGKSGIKRVYWDCYGDNEGSWRTAVACGFRHLASFEVQEIWR